MKLNILFTKMLFLSCLVLASGFFLGGCSDDEKELQPGYGYAQFKLFKKASAGQAGTRAGMNELDFLREAQKMKLVLINNEDGTEVTQTVGLNAMGNDSEFGLRSDKLELMAGGYTVVGFYLYKVNSATQYLIQILSGEPEETTVINVSEGGLVVQDILIKVIERGSVKFELTKSMIEATVRSEADADKFIFSDIRYATIRVEEQFSKQVTPLENIRFKYAEKVGTDKVGYEIATSDSVISLKAGTYKIIAYTLLDKDKKTLAGDALEGISFTITDNETAEVQMPVKIYKSAQRILDYLALKDIWDALDGKNWKYSGQVYPQGSNWNFDKEIDMWGNQPGVGLDAKGRVTTLNIGSFGGRGNLPAAIGQLTELKILTLGTHSDAIGDNIIEQWNGNVTTAQIEAGRSDYYSKFLKKHSSAPLSEVLQIGYSKLKGSQALPNTPSTRSAVTRDASTGNLSNAIGTIPKEVGLLTKLQQLYVANGKFDDFEAGTDLSKLENLTDLEFYNCPSMKKLPEALNKLPNVALINVANNPQISGEDFLAGIRGWATGASQDKIQILYLGNNNLTTLPAEFKNLKRIGKLDCTYNKITHLPAFGKEINFVQLTMDYNQITEIPKNFCGFDDVETFSFSHNKLTKFPNIFDAESVYTIASVNFSFNQITEFEDGDNFKGINVGTLSLSGNRLKDFPSILFKKNSRVSALLLSANGIENFPDGSLKGSSRISDLVTLDLTYNKLTKLPKEFNAVTLPYLYGFDLSNNSFSSFATEPLNIDHLNVFGFRNQRDKNGNRTIRDWPKGIFLCPSLKVLYLAGNDLRKIDDTVSPNVFMFEIKDNPNISIDMSPVCAYIKAGYYLLEYDRSQDIRGCDYLDLE